MYPLAVSDSLRQLLQHVRNTKELPPGVRTKHPQIANLIVWMTSDVPEGRPTLAHLQELKWSSM